MLIKFAAKRAQFPLIFFVLAFVAGFSGCDFGMNDIAKVTTFAGKAGDTGTLPGIGFNGNVITGGSEAVRFNRPEAMTYHNGYIYIGDSGNKSIRRILVSPPPGPPMLGYEAGRVDTIYTIAASGNHDIRGIAVDAAGNIIFSDHHGHQIKKLVVSESGGVVTITNTIVYGNGTRGGDDGLGATAMFNYPAGVALDTAGNIYVADMRNYKIRKIDAMGYVSTFAGSGANGYVDGKGAQAVFKEVIGLVFDKNGFLITADSYNQTLRFIDPAGNTGTYVSFFGDAWGFQDGSAGYAKGGRPQQLAYDIRTGNIYFNDRENAAIRMVTPGYTVHAPSEDEFASWTYPIKVRTPEGTDVLSDSRIPTEEKILGRFVTTIAGFRGFSRTANNYPGHGYRDGSNVDARFNMNGNAVLNSGRDGGGLAVTFNGDVYVSDTYNHVIRKIVRTLE